MVNITMLIISTIWFTLDLSVSSVPRPYLHMLGSSSLTRVFCVCKTGLHPLYVNRCLIMKNCRNGAYSGRTLIPWYFSKGSSYKASIVLSKIRCIKAKHHMQSKICDMIWPLSSCAFDLHLQSTVMISIVTGMTPWSPSSWSLSTCLHMVVSSTIAFATIAIA